MPTHTVVQGECLSRIASRYGFSDWKMVYDDPANADFRKKRPDPNLLHVGDRLFIPERNKKEVPCGTGRTHRFRLRRPERMLRLTVLDLAGQPVASAAYTLIVEGRTYTGITSGDGLVEQRISVDAETATLEANGHSWPLRIGHLNPLDETPDEGVTGLQARLRNLGYNVGPVDGQLGPRTAAAVRAFQRDNPPLKIDGICGPKTRAKLTQKHGC
jgi:hypothetical protein